MVMSSLHTLSIQLAPPRKNPVDAYASQIFFTMEIKLNLFLFRLRMMVWTLNSKYVWYKHYAIQKHAATSVLSQD